MENNKIAVITGATSGIGKEFAYKLASKGYNLLITGRREEILKKVAEEIQLKANVNIETYIIDLTDSRQFDIFIEKLEDMNNIEFLVNNAGYGAESAFTDGSFNKQLDMLKVHVIASMRLCHSLIKQMKKNKKGYIINVGSLAGFNTFPSSAMYCSTKAFLVNFSQCLAMEVRKHNIKVQVLCPGFTRTDFHEKLNMDENMLQNKGLVRWMTTKKVVDISIKNLNKDLKIIVIPGVCNKILYFVSKFVPRKIYYKVASRGWELMD